VQYSSIFYVISYYFEISPIMFALT